MSDTVTIPASRSALMLMDFQPSIIGSLPNLPELMASAQRALSWAREHNVQVVFVRVAFTDADYEAIPDWHPAFGAAKIHRPFNESDPATHVTPDFEVRESDIVVRKTRYGSFSTTDLLAQLETRGITTLVLGGVSTSGVVLSTTRDAGDRDYRIFALADAITDRDAEVHRVLMEKVLPRQATVIQTADLDGLTEA